MPALGKVGEEAAVDCTGTVEEEDSGLASLRREPNHFEDLLGRVCLGWEERREIRERFTVILR